MVELVSRTMMAMPWMIPSRTASYLVVHGSPHREVHHIVVRVSEGLARESWMVGWNIRDRSSPHLLTAAVVLLHYAANLEGEHLQY